MDVLFVHHSVGRRIIYKGDLRGKVGQCDASIRIWDHDYNHIGLAGPEGQPDSAKAFPIPEDNTDPPGLLRFLQLIGEDDSYRRRVEQFQVLILKSCYPNSNLESGRDLNEVKNVYREMTKRAAGLRQHVVVLTSPPLVREQTSAENARRARELSTWMTTSDELQPLVVVDLFGVLAARSGPFINTLSPGFRQPWPFDSHPNRRGAVKAADLVAKCLAGVRTASDLG